MACSTGSGIGPVMEPTKDDVLLGRGGRSITHEGNVRMRALVSHYQSEYTAEGAIDIDKLLIVDNIVKMVRRTGGRFLKKDPETNLWHEIGDENARKKVSQNIREATRELKRARQNGAQTTTSRNNSIAAQGLAKMNNSQRRRTRLDDACSQEQSGIHSRSASKRARSNTLPRCFGQTDPLLQAHFQPSSSLSTVDGEACFLQKQRDSHASSYSLDLVQDPTITRPDGGPVIHALQQPHFAPQHNLQLQQQPMNQFNFKQQSNMPLSMLFHEQVQASRPTTMEHVYRPVQQQQQVSPPFDPLVDVAAAALQAAGYSLQAFVSSLSLAQQHLITVPLATQETGNEREVSRGREVWRATEEFNEPSIEPRYDSSAREQNGAMVQGNAFQKVDYSAMQALCTSNSRQESLYSSELTETKDFQSTLEGEVDDTDAGALQGLECTTIREAFDPGLDEETAEFLIYTLKDQFDGPKFTDEQLENEKKEMTEQDRIEILSDLFGELCEITPTKKKLKRINTPHSASTPLGIQLLMRQMREAIVQIPIKKKAALEEALKKASPGEFSNDRLQMFLRCEDMVPENAANRLVNYWTRRRELFGPDKFHLPITQSGALRDDAAALKAGVVSMLPHTDASGRPMLLFTPGRNTRDGYSLDSLLRAIWYVHEAVAESPNATNGVVFLGYAGGATLWDCDRKLDAGMFSMERLYFPFRFCAFHPMGIPSLVMKLGKAVALAVLDKRQRNRLIFHYHLGGALLEELSSYGISKDAIPEYMGGTSTHNHEKWLEKRRNEGK